MCNWSLHHNLPVYVSAASAAAAGTEAASTAGAAVRQAFVFLLGGNPCETVPPIFALLIF